LSAFVRVRQAPEEHMMSTGTDTPTRPPLTSRSRGWQVIATALTLAAVAAASVTVWIWLRPPAHVTRSGLDTSASRQVTRTTARRLVISIDAGDLTLRPGPAGRVTEQRTLTWKTKPPVVTESVAHGTLTITARCPAGQAGACAAGLTLTVPPGVTVSARVTSGDVSATGLRGAVRLAAVHGSLRLSRLSGPLQLNTAGGGIVGEALTATRVSARAAAGDIALAFTAVPAAVSAASDAGDVSIDVPRLAGGYRVRAATLAGDRAVSVGTDPRSPDAIVATSDAGDVAVAYSAS
jgi:Putative adhesin